MVDRILEAARTSTFDFRTIANPQDTLKPRFDEWVEYYRLKSAVAAVIQPKTILEIGVRYGYSAAAFLHGAPQAHYTGIDLDIDAFGGGGGGLEYARGILPRSATLIHGNSQQMQELPGAEVYDLIHVDGQQDEPGILHDLQLALRHTRYILVDGFFWTRANFFGGADFLVRFRPYLDYFAVIPGYAGELLIAVKPEAQGRHMHLPAGWSRPIDPARRYENGGWVFQQQVEAAAWDESCSHALLMLSQAWSPGSILHLGASHSNLALTAAAAGVKVVTFFADPEMATQARISAATDPHLADHAEWIVGDISQLAPEQLFDCVIMELGDGLQNVSMLEQWIDALRSRLVSHAKLILSISPHRLYAHYGYARRRRLAEKVGAYLPECPDVTGSGPSTTGPDCSPAALRRRLRKHFPHLLIWFGTARAPLDGLRRPLTRTAVERQSHCFIVAAGADFTAEPLTAMIEGSPLTPYDASQVQLDGFAAHLQARVGENLFLRVRLDNHSSKVLLSEGPFPTFLSYHWWRVEDRSSAIFEGHRNPLTMPQPPESSRIHRMLVSAPAQAGRYLLQVTLVQEKIMWFETHGSRAHFQIEVDVAASG